MSYIDPERIDPRTQAEWRKKYSPKALRHFMRPARVCEYCGIPMDKDPKTQEPHTISEWERKWSIHRVCADEIEEKLDRSIMKHTFRE